MGTSFLHLLRAFSLQVQQRLQETIQLQAIEHIACNYIQCTSFTTGTAVQNLLCGSKVQDPLIES